jgi:hypothetical protein
MSNYVEGNKNTIFDYVNFKKEQYKLLNQRVKETVYNYYSKNERGDSD